MKKTVHLFVSQSGNVRVNKTGAGASPSELVIQFNLDIPDRFFRRPVPVATLRIPEESLGDPSIDSIVAVTALQVSEALKLDLQLVTDGLMSAVDWEKQNGANVP